MSTIIVQVTLVGETTEVTDREGDGKKRQMEERHKTVHKVQKLCIQYMVLVTFHNMVIFLYILLVRLMIKDSAKPIYISKLAKHSSSSFINICNSNIKSLHVHIFID